MRHYLAYTVGCRCLLVNPQSRTPEPKPIWALISGAESQLAVAQFSTPAIRFARAEPSRLDAAASARAAAWVIDHSPTRARAPSYHLGHGRIASTCVIPRPSPTAPLTHVPLARRRTCPPWPSASPPRTPSGHGTVLGGHAWLRGAYGKGARMKKQTPCRSHERVQLTSSLATTEPARG